MAIIYKSAVMLICVSRVSKSQFLLRKLGIAVHGTEDVYGRESPDVHERRQPRGRHGAETARRKALGPPPLLPCPLLLRRRPPSSSVTSRVRCAARHFLIHHIHKPVGKNERLCWLPSVHWTRLLSACGLLRQCVRVCSLSHSFRRVLDVGSSRRARNHFTATGFVLRESLFAANAAPVLLLLQCLLLHHHFDILCCFHGNLVTSPTGDFPYTAHARMMATDSDATSDPFLELCALPYEQSEKRDTCQRCR